MKITQWLVMFVMLTLSIFSGAINENVIQAAVSPTVVSKYGQLQVLNGQLCDHNGKPIQLKGISTMGLQWFPYTGGTVRNLAKDWHISVLRIAMYTKEFGFIDNPLVKTRVKILADEAIAQGIYVIIDWHILSDRNPNQYKEQAKAFFTEMATLYGPHPNVIYEICNEPNGSDVTWNGKIKPYAEYIIPAIRAIDPDNIIVVGTDTWSRGVRAAADNPLKYPNIMYTLHFYAGSHSQQMRDNADYALSKGIAIFVTEWGTSKDSGDGGVFFDAAGQWLDWMAEHKISWVNWSLCDKDESSAALKPWVGVEGPWSDAQLSASGKWVKAKIMEQ